jgi:hypothetical protein
MPQRTMPTTDPAMTKVKKMNKIVVKRTKRNDSVYKRKRNWRRSWRMKIQIMNPISLRPKILMMKWMYPTANLHLKLLLFRKTIGCVMLAILLLMESKTSHLLMKVLQSPTSIRMIITRILFLPPPFHLLQ